MRYRTGEDFESGSKFLTAPGCYHFVVAFLKDPATNREGVPIAGALFNVGLAVLAGGDGNQKGKTLDLTFFEPSMDAKDGGKFQRKKVDRFLLAMNLIDEEAKDQDVELDLTQCTGRQLCIKLEARNYKDRSGKEREGLDVHYADIYHVDDPEVATWDRDVASLQMIPKKFRKVQAAKPANGTAKEAAAKPADAKAVEQLEI